jgi:hypothetical protein
VGRKSAAWLGIVIYAETDRLSSFQCHCTLDLIIAFSTAMRRRDTESLQSLVSEPDRRSRSQTALDAYDRFQLSRLGQSAFRVKPGAKLCRVSSSRRKVGYRAGNDNI